MLQRSELKQLQEQNDYPSVSVLAPTHRTAPANKKDRLVVKNLINKALDRLAEEFQKREVAAVVQNLANLERHVDWEHALDGLALFASKNVARMFYLPFRVKARVQIDGTYASGIDQVWRAAAEKRCRTLLVETDYEYPADLAPTEDHLLPYTGRGATALDDAVDEVIERVLAAGGEVFFYDAGVLDVHQHIAAVLRY